MSIQLPSKGNGQKLSKKEINAINMQQIAQQAMNEHTARVNGFIQEFANTAIYEGVREFDLSGLVQKALIHFSDLILKMPYDTYRGIALVTDGRYTYQQFDIILQVLGMSSAFNLGMESIGYYIQFKDQLQILMGDFATALEGHKQRIKDENPFMQVNQPAEA